MAFKISWASFLRFFLLLLLLAAIVIACFTLPVEKILRDFLAWVEEDLGPWGPLVLAVAYIPLTILAVPASVLTLGGGYLFGLPVGFVADSVGATIGAGAAFLLGRTLGRPFVMSKLKDYPQFRAVEIAIRRSGFKIVLLLRLVPLLPFNMLNYLLSPTDVGSSPFFTHASSFDNPAVASAHASHAPHVPLPLLLLPRLHPLAPYQHDPDHACIGVCWNDFEGSFGRWAFIAFSLVVSVVLMIIVTRVAKSALEKALAENEDADGSLASPELPVAADPTSDLRRLLVIKVDTPQENQE